MKKIDNEELFLIVGGINITGTLINSITSGITKILDLGRSLGTAIRRVIGNSVCPL